MHEFSANHWKTRIFVETFVLIWYLIIRLNSSDHTFHILITSNEPKKQTITTQNFNLCVDCASNAHIDFQYRPNELAA